MCSIGLFKNIQNSDHLCMYLVDGGGCSWWSWAVLCCRVAAVWWLQLWRWWCAACVGGCSVGATATRTWAPTCVSIRARPLSPVHTAPTVLSVRPTSRCIWSAYIHLGEQPVLGVTTILLQLTTCHHICLCHRLCLCPYLALHHLYLILSFLLLPPLITRNNNEEWISKDLLQREGSASDAVILLIFCLLTNLVLKLMICNTTSKLRKLCDSVFSKEMLGVMMHIIFLHK